MPANICIVAVTCQHTPVAVLCPGADAALPRGVADVHFRSEAPPECEMSLSYLLTPTCCWSRCLANLHDKQLLLHDALPTACSFLQCACSSERHAASSLPAQGVLFQSGRKHDGAALSTALSATCDLL